MPIRLPNPTISEIEPGLYLGDLGSSYNISILTSNKITAMVSLSNTKSARWSLPQNREVVSEDCHLYIHCLDSSTQDLISRMNEICDWIEENRRDGRANVLVHCTMGISRSAAVVIAYLMRKYCKSLDSSLASVQKSRKVKPNPNFMEQLAVWAETEYEPWTDSSRTIPKPPYAAFLALRAERLRAKVLTLNEPVCKDL